MEAVIRAKVQLINHCIKKAHSTGAVITIKRDSFYTDKVCPERQRSSVPLFLNQGTAQQSH